MKVGGVPIDGPKKVTLVLPRENGDLIFHFVAVSDDSEFEKLYPEPVPPKTFLTATQETKPDYDDDNYKASIIAFRKARQAWLVIKSMEPSNIEWDLVKMADPNTFDLWNEDFKQAGLSISEVNAVWAHYLKANIVTDEMLQEARMRFLASQGLA